MDEQTLLKLKGLLAGLEQRAQKDYLTAEKQPEYYEGRASGYIHAARMLQEILSGEPGDTPPKEDQPSA